MLERPEIIDELQGMLSNWVSSLGAPKPLGAYLFGSTINEGGVRFQSDKGDLDVAIVVDWEGMSPGDRVEQVNILRHAKGALELHLLQKLHRTNAAEQIVSLVPVTPFEIEHAVHKDHIRHIMTDALGYDLVARKEIPNLGGGTAPQPLTEGHRTVLAFIQKKRAEALSMRPNGTGGLKHEPHDDPVPKELQRNFAVATFDPNKDADPSDLVRGLREIGRFANEAANWTPMTSSFASWLEVRQGARGTVSSLISDDHYLLVLETIYDRVRVQYPAAATVCFNLHSESAPLTAAPSLPASHRLGARFVVSANDKLGGTKDDVLRAVRAARANMKARAPDPFDLVFEESPRAEALLATDDADLGSSDHREKVKAFERRTIVAARQARWKRGVELILWYGGTLFDGDETIVEEACRTAISNWFAVAATNVVNPGGMFEASHLDFYRSHGLAVSFPADTSVAKALEGLRPLTVIKPKKLAGGFVPNLVSKYLYLISQSERADLQESADQVFDVRNWQFGVK